MHERTNIQLSATERNALESVVTNRNSPQFRGRARQRHRYTLFNEAIGELTKLPEETSADNPNYLAVHENGERRAGPEPGLGQLCPRKPRRRELEGVVDGAHKVKTSSLNCSCKSQ